MKIVQPSVLFLLVGILLLGVTNCKKQEITTYENLVIDGNKPPNYDGVSEIQIEVYVSKLYIDLLGVQATQAEMTSGVTYLKNNELRMGARDTLISQLLVKDAYYDRLYTNAKAKFIEGINDFQLNQEIATYNFIINLLLANGDTFDAQITEIIRNKLVTLRDADSLYKNNSITINQFYATFCDNIVYDDINMGSLNFVQACFENYFLRQPTASETTMGVEMIDGDSRIILLQNGNSKDDFIRIITQSQEFYEGLVRENYRGFLARDPSSLEAHQATVPFKNSNDLAEMQKSILKTDEYAGF